MDQLITIIKRWVEDLESGQHKQCQGDLHYATSDGDFFCCLGRLCELAIADGLNVERLVTPQIEGKRLLYSYNGKAHMLPDQLKQWAGIPYSFIINYAAMNDNGKTFKEIAQRVREDFNLD